jgi:ribonuclease G
VRRELILSVAPGEIRGALMEDGRPVELVLERDVEASLAGAVFFARIQRIVPSLPGAFLDLGLGRPGFLPGEIALTEGAGLPVRIVKDGFADKGPEVSAALERAGRFAVWTPSRPGIAVSRKIEPAERARLSAILAELVEAGEGVVLRSQAAGAAAAEIAADLAALRQAHAALLAAAASGTAPRRLDPAPDALDRIAAGIGPEIGRVVIDDRAGFARLRRLVVTPDRIVLDTGDPGLAEIFDQALATRLALAGGGEIVIEAMTAFTAIDVNLGAATGRRGRAAEAIRAVNTTAAIEIAQQLRLRNIGGAVVVDFISMAARADRDAVAAALAEALAADPVPVERHGWTRLGHFELTRRRGVASIAERMLAPEAGRVKTPLTVALAALRVLAAARFAPGRIRLRCHPAVAAEFDGRLAVIFDTAKAAAGRAVSVAVEPGRDPETFDFDGA